MTCVAVLSEGSDCSHDVFGCGDGLICEAGASIVCSTFSAQAGLQCVCTRTLPDGAACRDGRQCALSQCNDGRCQSIPIDENSLLICGQ
jgi:hypothetical protein